MKKLILTLCLAATGTFAAVAQMRLTLDQALDLALSENPTIKVAEMEVQRYDYVKRQTWGGLLPQVSVTGQVNHSFIVQQMSKGFSLGNDPYTTLSGAVDAKKVKLHTIQKQSVITSRARKRESPILSLSRVKVM